MPPKKPSTLCPGGVDLTDEFELTFGSKQFASFDEFDELLVAFQRATATCYEIISCKTAKRWLTTRNEYIPSEIKYKYVGYQCIHGTRKKVSASERRFEDYNCQSRINLAYLQGTLQITSKDMVHSHTPDISQPWIYPRNRQLSADQKSTVLALLEAGEPCRDVKGFVHRYYDIQVNYEDVRKLKQQALAPDAPDSSDLDSSDEATTDAIESTREEQAHELTRRLYELLLQQDDDMFEEAMAHLMSYGEILECSKRQTQVGPVISPNRKRSAALGSPCSKNESLPAISSKQSKSSVSPQPSMRLNDKVVKFRPILPKPHPEK